MTHSLFNKEYAQQIIARINQLQPNQKPLWGQMNSNQMLAHCNVAYDMAFHPEKHKKPGFFGRFLFKMFVKPMVVSDQPYAKNGRTAPVFIVSGDKDFHKEQQTLIQHIEKCVALGTSTFEGKENINFGKMSSSEWNTLFLKHLQHHLQQFGV